MASSANRSLPPASARPHDNRGTRPINGLLPDFRPHPLLINAHAQTLLAMLASATAAPYRAEQHIVTLDDGDGLVLHDDRPPRWQTGEAVALLLHGLGGCHRSPYLVRIADKLNRRGIRAFRLDLRGCGAGLPLATRPFHAGQSGDLRQALQQVARLCPGSPVTLVGFSLGGNIVLKLAGELGGEPPEYLRRVVAIAPPIDLRACVDNLRRGPGRLYDRAFLQMLLRMRRQRSRAGYVDVDLRPLPHCLYDFDNRYTAPLSGFRDADDYYGQSSAAPLLHRVAVPTTILASRDDPLVPPAPFHQAQLSDRVQLHLTRYGGHLGYLAAAGDDPDRRWMDWRVVHLVSAATGQDLPQ